MNPSGGALRPLGAAPLAVPSRMSHALRKV